MDDIGNSILGLCNGNAVPMLMRSVNGPLLLPEDDTGDSTPRLRYAALTRGVNGMKILSYMCYVWIFLLLSKERGRKVSG